MEIPKNKKAFLLSNEPLTLFAFINLATNEATYKLTHPKDELATQQAGVLKNPENIYLYIRNQAARDFIGVYGTDLYNTKGVTVII